MHVCFYANKLPLQEIIICVILIDRGSKAVFCRFFKYMHCPTFCSSSSSSAPAVVERKRVQHLCLAPGLPHVPPPPPPPDLLQPRHLHYAEVELVRAIQRPPLDRSRPRPSRSLPYPSWSPGDQVLPPGSRGHVRPMAVAVGVERGATVAGGTGGGIRSGGGQYVLLAHFFTRAFILLSQDF